MKNDEISPPPSPVYLPKWKISEPGSLNIYLQAEAEQWMNGAYVVSKIVSNITSLCGIQQGNYILKVEIYCTEVEGRKL